MPTQWVLGQHREVCAMLGKGWGRKHRTVDWAWKYGRERLVGFACAGVFELRSRRVNAKWPSRNGHIGVDHTTYPEHDYDQCAKDLVDLERKVSNPDKWKLLYRDDLRRLRQVGIYLPVSAGGRSNHG